MTNSLVVGDWVLSRDENDPQGPVLAQRVEEKFVRTGQVWHLDVGGRRIRTTQEHPFFAEGRGWTALAELAIGDRLLGENGDWLTIEALEDTGKYETVYNLRVSETHTYFVGCAETWGFSVWAHNSYGDFAESLGLARDDMRFEAQYRWAMLNPGNWNAFQRQLAGQGFSVRQKAAAWSRAQADAPEAAIADQVYREAYQQAAANGRRTTESAFDPTTGTLRTRASGGGEPSAQADYPHLLFPDPPLSPMDPVSLTQRPPGTCGMPRAAHDVINAIGGVPTDHQIYITQGGFFVNRADGQIWYRAPCENCGGLPGQAGTVALNPVLTNLPLPPGVPEGLAPGQAVPFNPPLHW